MASQPFAAALNGFRTWASAPDRSLAGEADADARELELIFGLMSDQLGINSPAELRRGHVEELLLDVYPRKVVVGTEDDTEETIAAFGDFLTYLDDTNGLAATQLSQLRHELDEVAPEFAGAVMDRANWGPSRAVVDSMLGDGVDLEDQAAVMRWISQYNAALEPGAVEPPGLKELFDLPDEMAPMRLPEDSELAAIARTIPMMSRLVALADWVGEDGRLLDEDEELTSDDAAEGATAVGVSADEFHYLWEIGYAADWIDADSDDSDGEFSMFPASCASDWADGTDDDVLACWDATLEAVLAETLLLPTEDEAEPGIDFEGHGVALFIFLFLLRQAGLTRTDAREIMREGVLGEQPLPVLTRAWNEFTQEYGDPADLVLERAAELGAVSLGEADDPEVRLSPLGLWAVRRQLLENGVDIPLLPPVAEMGAVDLLSAAAGLDSGEFDAEVTAWLESRDPLEAARELLSLASAGEPADRVLASGIATRIGPPAEPAWREVMDAPELAPYARVALIGLAGGIPGESEIPGLELSPSDMAWMTTDVLAILCSDSGPDDPPEAEELVEQLAATVPPGQEPGVFELISRGSHPLAVEVLTMIGQHHPDKAVAKEARKCAYKAATRRASGR